MSLPSPRYSQVPALSSCGCSPSCPACSARSRRSRQPSPTRARSSASSTRTSAYCAPSPRAPRSWWCSTTCIGRISRRCCCSSTSPASCRTCVCSWSAPTVIPSWRARVTVRRGAGRSNRFSQAQVRLDDALDAGTPGPQRHPCLEQVDELAAPDLLGQGVPARPHVARVAGPAVAEHDPTVRVERLVGAARATARLFACRFGLRLLVRLEGNDLRLVLDREGPVVLLDVAQDAVAVGLQPRQFAGEPRRSQAAAARPPPCDAPARPAATGAGAAAARCWRARNRAAGWSGPARAPRRCAARA